MGEQQAQRVSGSCLGGVFGAVIGIILGGFIGHYMISVPERDAQLPVTSGLFRFAGGIVQLGATILGAGICGIVGGIGGSMFGAGQIANKEPETVNKQIVPDNPDEEIARLHQRIAEIERTKTQNKSAD